MSDSRGGRRLDLLHHKGAVILLQVLLLGAAVLLLRESWEASLDLPELDRLLAWLFTAHAAWAFLSWRSLTGRLIDGYTLFLLSTILFSGGQVVLSCFDVLPDGILGGRFSALTLQRSIAMVNACVASLHLGALLTATRPAGPLPSLRPPDEIEPGLERLKKIGYLFLLVSAPPMAVRTLEMLTVVSQSGYFGLYQQEAKLGLQNWDAILAGFFIPGVLVLMATGSNRRRSRRLAWSLAVATAIVNMFLGARAAALMALLPMLLLHHELVKPIKVRWGLALAALGLVIIPMVAQVRGLSLDERLESSGVNRAPSGVAIVAGVEEMGRSMDTVAHSIELVPQVRPFDGGSGYLRALSTILPNLFWDVHPALEAGSYAQWLMREVDPALFHRGGGIGYSMVAEAYINAQWFGAPVVLFLIGVLVGSLVRWSRAGGGALRLAIEAVVISSALVLPRGETGMVVRPIVWTALVPYLLARASPRWPRRAAMPGNGGERAPDAEGQVGP